MIAFVYLAGPITGLGFDGATDWRVEAKNLLGARGIPTASPMRAKDYLAEMDNLADAYLDGHPLSRPAEKIEDEYGRVYEPESFLERLEHHLEVNPEEPPYAGELGPQDDPYRILDRGFRGYPGEFS